MHCHLRLVTARLQVYRAGSFGNARSGRSVDSTSYWDPITRFLATGFTGWNCISKAFAYLSQAHTLNSGSDESWIQYYSLTVPINSSGEGKIQLSRSFGHTEALESGTRTFACWKILPDLRSL